MGQSRRETFTMHPRWAPRLSEAGLGNFDALLNAGDGEAMSRHRNRSETLRVRLGSQTVFLKKAVSTEYGEIAHDLMCLRHPEPTSEKECWAFEQVAALGIATPMIIARGQRRRVLGLPYQGVFVALPLPGREVGQCLDAEADDRRRGEMMRQVGRAVRKLGDANFCWPDLLARHVYVDDDLQVGMLDLERLTPARGHRKMAASIGRFVKDLRKAGAGDGDLRAMFEGLAEAHDGRSQWAADLADQWISKLSAAVEISAATC